MDWKGDRMKRDVEAEMKNEYILFKFHKIYRI